VPLLPIGKKIVCTILRGGKNIKRKIKLLPLAEDQKRYNIEQSYIVFNKGNILLNNGDAYGALELFKHALWLNPYEPLFYSALGDAYYRIGLEDFAIDELQKAVHMAPHRFGYYVLADIYLGQKEYSNASEAFQKVLALGPADIELWGKLGFCYFQLEKYADALTMYQNALRIQEDLPIATYYAAQCFDKQHNTEKALYFYRRFSALGYLDEEMSKKSKERIDFLSGIKQQL